MRIRFGLRWPLAAALACGALWATEAPAQDDEPQAESFCFRGRPAAECRTFLVLEGNAYMAVAGSRFERLGYRGERTQSLELTGYVAWEAGAMVNITSDQAVGGTFTLGGDANGFRVALKGRYRRWHDRASAIDLGAGIMGAGRSVAYTDREGNYHVPAVGLTADASIGLVDWASVGARADVLFSEEGEGPAIGYYGGVRLGTKPMLAASAAPLVLAVIIFVVAGGSGG
jgi:hypothetical protein